MSNTDQLRTVCSFCAASNFKRVFGQDHFLVKCRNCGLVCTDHIPSIDTLTDYYHSYPSYDKVSHLTLVRYNEILDKLEPYRTTGNLLEAGCGFGFFLVEAKKRNWNVYGTELSITALQECRRKDLTVSDSLEQLKQSHELQFDVVVSIEVIEHLSEPVREIEDYARLVKPGGLLYITTPNFNSLSRRILGRRWNVIIYPEHIFYFTIPTIRKLLTKNNFTRLKEDTFGFSHARMIFAIRQGRNDKSADNYDYNEKDRELRDAIEKTVILRLLKKLINTLLSLFNAGDTLKILYQKK